MNQTRLDLLDDLTQEPSGLAWCGMQTNACDKVLRRIWEIHAPESPKHLAIFATGGYGRRELSPHSDLDLTLLSVGEVQDDGLIRALFRSIQTEIGEAWGLKIGYTYRTLGDFPGLDASSRTALLDARLVAGDEEMAPILNDSLWKDFPTGDFLIAKFRERAAAFTRWHSTPLVTEPNLKEGAGGLRCLQTAQWVRMALGETLINPTPDYEWLIMVRSLLHLKANRVMDLLSYERRGQIANLLAVTPIALAEKTAESMSALHKFWRETESCLARSSFLITEHVTSQKGHLYYGPGTTSTEAALAITLASQLPGIQVTSAPPLADKGSGSHFLAAIGGGVASVKALDQAGVLAQILPEITACRFLMPGDSAHRYTVLEHTLVLLEHFESAEMPSFLTEIKASLPDPSLLILAGLLHDVGKIDRSRPHSIVGAEMSVEICTRLGLPGAQTVLVRWLVLEHLYLSRIIQIRDVQDPLVLQEAARHCGTVQRLDLLTLLTWADISAVNPEAMTPLTLAYLEHVWRSARQILTEGQEIPDPAGMRRRLTRSLASTFPPEEITAFLDSLPSNYLLSTPPSEVQKHMELMKRVVTDGPEIHMIERPAIEATEVLIGAVDRLGLLRDVLAVFYALDLRLHSVKARTTQGETPLILDLFTVSYGRRPLPPLAAAKLEADLRRVLTGQTSAYDLMKTADKDPARAQELYNWTFTPGSPATLEVRAPRGRGMAYRMSNRITELGWIILGARVGQWAGAAAATFSLVGPEGKALTRADADQAFGQANV